MRKFRPNALVDRVTHIALPELWAMGIRCLLLDVDNTIANWNEQALAPDVVAWIEKAQALGFDIVLISNNHAPRIEPIARQLNARMLPDAGKPKRRAFKLAAELAGHPCAQCAMIGDQVITDMLGANRAGMHSILVNPLHHQEFAGTKINRRLERFILFLLRIKRP